MTAHEPEIALWVADAQRYLAAAREPRAAGAGPDTETLRRAYLDLLKLCLCDLVSTSTASVGALEDRTLMQRELRGDDRRLRAAGMDWPLQGLTMVGLHRLDDLQACVESIVGDGIDGDVIEAGAWRGGASLFVRAALDTMGDDRAVWVADSFAGFPAVDASDSEAHRLSAFGFLAVPLDEVRDTFARLGCEHGVEFLPGFFEDTLATVADRRWALVRLDADTYEPTRLALDTLYPGLAPGGYLVIDDYGSFQGCRQAVDHFREDNEIAEPLERIDFSGVRWRRESDAPIRPRPRSASRRSAAAPESRRPTHIPTARELELEAEVADLRAQLASAGAAIGLRPWLQRRLRGRRG
jgi:O-methyltransferase